MQTGKLTSNEKKEEISSHFQMAVTASLFFPLIWENFLTKNQVDAQAISNEVVAWSYLVSTIIAAYIAFEIFKKHIRPFFLVMIDWVVLLWIALLGVMFFVLFDAKDGLMQWHIPIMKTSMLSVMFSPYLMIVLMIGSWSFDRLSEAGTMTKEIVLGLKAYFSKRNE